MIPNTTPTPNELYNGEMRKMSDTELRVVMIVTRSTLGWEFDHKTGMRKQEDWISSSQLVNRTGRSGRAISTAIDGCIKKGWVEARDKNGNILDTKAKRIGNKIYYRLGKIFLEKITSEKSSEVKEQTSEKSSIEDSSFEKSSLYKRNTITKEKHNKNIATQRRCGNDINNLYYLTDKSEWREPEALNDPWIARGTKRQHKDNKVIKDTNIVGKADGLEINLLIEKFKPINPSYERLFANITQRKALERLIKKYTPEKVGAMIDALPGIVSQKYAPQISTPAQLENKLGQLLIFIKQNKQQKGEIIL